MGVSQCRISMLLVVLACVGLLAVKASDPGAPPPPPSLEERFEDAVADVEEVDAGLEFEERDGELHELELREDEEASVDDIITQAAQITGFSAALTELPMEDGSVVQEGDMLLTPEQQAEDNLNKRMAELGLAKRKGIKNTRYRWPNNIMPYEIAGGTFSSSDMREINNAIADWNKYTCISIQKRRSEKNYIKIQNGGGCSSYVGVINYGAQPVSLARGCRYKRIVLHELGHALGFQHEQCRYDRDDYLTIHLNNVQSSMRHNFNKYTRSNMVTHEVKYDYSSVMQYGETAFGGGRRTITTKDPAYQRKIGKSRGLSFADLKTMNLMYKCGERCSGSCPSNGYMDKNCQCQCPSGQDNFRDGTVPIKTCGSGGGSTGGGSTGGGSTGGGSTGGGSNCSDKNKNCSYWRGEGYCRGRYANYMRQNCPKSCGHC